MANEVISNGATVWINSQDGYCLGRFSRMGIDIHKDAFGQESGKHCLDCKPGLTTMADWQRFKRGMMVFHGVVVAERHKPKFLRAAAQSTRKRSA